MYQCTRNKMGMHHIQNEGVNSQLDQMVTWSTASDNIEGYQIGAH